MTIGLRDMAMCASAVLRGVGTQPEMVKSAVTWAIRNRLQQEADLAQLSHRAIGEICLAVIADLPPTEKCALQPCEDGREQARSFAVTGLVWADAIDDPTGGASRCHWHDTLPHWARDLEPSALIGPVMFYR